MNMAGSTNNSSCRSYLEINDRPRPFYFWIIAADNRLPTKLNVCIILRLWLFWVLLMIYTLQVQHLIPFEKTDDSFSTLLLMSNYSQRIQH